MHDASKGGGTAGARCALLSYSCSTHSCKPATEQLDLNQQFHWSAMVVQGRHGRALQSCMRRQCWQVVSRADMAAVAVADVADAVQEVVGSKEVQRYLLQPARVMQAQQEQKILPGTAKGLEALTQELYAVVPTVSSSLVWGKGGGEGVCCSCELYLGTNSMGGCLSVRVGKVNSMKRLFLAGSSRALVPHVFARA
jgi:hypothetical protein